MKLSACMIVQDEEECLARALDSIHPYVDEIIVVDSGSTDRTRQIASQYEKVRLFEIPFPDPPDFSVQRNAAIERASGDWIFIIDADEYCEPYVMKQFEILITLDEYDAYHFARLTLINGYLHNKFDGDRTYRLFKKHCRYAGPMHEQVQNIKSGQELNLFIVHDKKAEWQQKDNERFWDMGQLPPYGWVKRRGVWKFIGNTGYDRPDPEFWQEGDERLDIDDYDEALFRSHHNDDMLNERLLITTLDQVGLSMSEGIIVDEIVQLPEPRSVLDLGCANGKFIFALLRDGLVSEATGVDISDNMVQMAISSAATFGFEAQFTRAALEAFETDRVYSVVVGDDILEHLFNVSSMVEKIAGFVAPGGLFCGSVPDLMECNSRNHLHYFTKDSLYRLLNTFFPHVVVDRVDYYAGNPELDEFHLVFRCRK